MFAVLRFIWDFTGPWNYSTNHMERKDFKSRSTETLDASEGSGEDILHDSRQSLFSSLPDERTCWAGFLSFVRKGSGARTDQTFPCSFDFAHSVQLGDLLLHPNLSEIMGSDKHRFPPWLTLSPTRCRLPQVVSLSHDKSVIQIQTQRKWLFHFS